MGRRPKEIIELDKLRDDFTLLPVEQETIINFDRGSPDVIVYTADKYIMAKLDKLEYECIRTDTVNGNEMAKTYKCEKRNISFRSKAKTKRSGPKKQLTEEHKQKMIEGRKKK